MKKLNLVNLFAHADCVQTLPAGHKIVKQGDPGEHFFVVLDGQADVIMNDLVVEQMGAGDVFGEMTLIDAGPRSATVVAKTPCRVAIVDEKRFLFMVQQTPHFALQVMHVMAQRLRRRTS